jgi:hypothetical protein
MQMISDMLDADTATRGAHTQFSAAFTTNIAESNFRYTQDFFG